MSEDKKLEKRKKDLWLEGLDLVRTVLICLVSVYIFVHFFFRPVQVDGESMHPTLLNDEIGLSNVFARLTGKINRFDVVVLKEPSSGDLWVKRVIGLPGETVKYQDGKLYINDRYVKEPFLDKEYMIKDSGSIENFTKDFNVDGDFDYNQDGKITPLGEHEYFVMGDNRNNSFDSRARGAFTDDQIVSKAVFVIYPFNKMGYIE